MNNWPRGLFNTLIDAIDKDDLVHRDALMKELRDLATKHDEPVVREHLAGGLLNTLNTAKDEDNLAYHNALAELQNLIDTWPNDYWVVEFRKRLP